MCICPPSQAEQGGKRRRRKRKKKKKKPKVEVKEEPDPKSVTSTDIVIEESVPLGQEGLEDAKSEAPTVASSLRLR